MPSFSRALLGALAVLLLALAPTDAAAQTPLAACIDGTAAGYPCENVDLLAYLSSQSLGAPAAGACPEPYTGLCANDIWGWEDAETGRRYAIVGLANGTAFVDVTVPTAPLRLGMLPTATNASSWRDVKAIGPFALVVAEAPSHGMQIFDMRGLRGLSPDASRRFTADARYTGVGSAHNIVVDEATGFAYAVGAADGVGGLPAECAARGLHAIDLSDPLYPAFAGCITDVYADPEPYRFPGYTHDAQCLVYDGPDADYTGRELCFAANEEDVTVFDVTDKANAEIVSVISYPNDTYTHQGWLTEDRRYFITNDELDEYRNNVPTQRTMIIDVSDLDDPELAFIYDSGITTIDHNLYTYGGLIFQSNYEAGLRVLDPADIDQGLLDEVAYFDTYPLSTTSQFAGQWSNYPYFGDGLVLANDGETGFFVLQVDPTLLATATSGPATPRAATLSEPRPNPTSGTAELTLAVDTPQPVRAELFDVAGRRVATLFDGPATPGADLAITVDRGDLPAGLYVVRVTGATFTAARRLVLTR